MSKESPFKKRKPFKHPDLEKLSEPIGLSCDACKRSMTPEEPLVVLSKPKKSQRGNMRESKEEKFAKKALTQLVNKLHSGTTRLTWLHIHDLLGESAKYACNNYLQELLQDLKNYDADEKSGRAGTKKKEKR